MVLPKMLRSPHGTGQVILLQTITGTYDIADEAPWVLTPQVNKAFQMLSMINKWENETYGGYLYIITHLRDQAHLP